MTAINDGGAGATFDDVVRLEVSERVLGGADGSPANRHGLALARRSRYILNRLNGTIQQAVWTTTVITATNAAAYTVPATGVIAALLTGQAPGGGGGCSVATLAGPMYTPIPGPGGGQGARFVDHPIVLVPGAVMAATIGAPGAGAVHDPAYTGTPSATVITGRNGTDGGDITFAGITLHGGKGADGVHQRGGQGGTVTVDGIALRGAPGESTAGGGGGQYSTGGSGGGPGGGRGGASIAGDTTAAEAGLDGGGGGGGGWANTYLDAAGGGPGYFILKVLTLQPLYTA